MPQWLKTFFAHASAILLIIAVIGAIAKPHAQDFVEDTVDERIGKLENQMDEVQDLLKEQQSEQAVFKNTLGHIQQNQADTKSNTRMIFETLQDIQRDIRE